MSTVTFYHAGCPVCVSAEKELVNLISDKVTVQSVHLGEEKGSIPKAESLGVKSVPALVLDNGQVLHINYGAGIDDLKD